MLLGASLALTDRAAALAHPTWLWPAALFIKVPFCRALIGTAMLSLAERL